MGKLRIGIVGSRNFGDLSRVSSLVEALHEAYGDGIVIVSGGARGVDKTAVDTAKRLKIEYKEHLPDPNVKPFVKAANDRNTKIVEDSDKIYAFWSVNKESTGTVDTMYKALMAGKLEIVYTPKGVLRNTYNQQNQ